MSPATISSVASVTGNRTLTKSGLVNVLLSAAVACVKWAAATQAEDDRPGLELGRRPLGAQQVAEHAHPERRPADPVVDEHAALAGRPARRDRGVAVQQVAAGRDRLEVIVDEIEREPVVGDDPVEVLHQVGLGHRRKLAQARLVEPVEIHAGEAVAMPRRAVDGVAHDLAQPLGAVGGEPIGRPVEPLDETRRKRGRVGQVPLPLGLVVTHARGPSHGLWGRAW